MAELQEPTDLMVIPERVTPSGIELADIKLHGGLGFEKMFVSLQCTAMCRDRVSDRVPPTGHRGMSHFYFTSFSIFSSMM